MMRDMGLSSFDCNAIGSFLPAIRAFLLTARASLLAMGKCL